MTGTTALKPILAYDNAQIFRPRTGADIAALVATLPTPPASLNWFTPYDMHDPGLHVAQAIQHGRASLYSERSHALFRNLSSVRHLILPNADMAMLPVLSVVKGSLVARRATYVDARNLSSVEHYADMRALEVVDFPALARVGDALNLPAARTASFPQLREVGNGFRLPGKAKINAPRLTIEPRRENPTVQGEHSTENNVLFLHTYR